MPYVAQSKKTTLQAFVEKLEVVATGCWLWTAATSTQGYGRLMVARPGRWSYEYFVGPIPEGLELDHLCRVRNCVNPTHVEPVTRWVNIMRGEGPRVAVETVRKRFAAMTHCKRGHPFDDRNTFRHHGRRSCRACHAAAERARQWRVRNAGVASL
jgi:HNH endonuclease